MSTTYTWTGSSGSGNWADAGNWTPSGYPGAAGDIAIIDADGTYTITVAQGETDAVSSLTLDAAGVTLSVAGTLAFSGADTVAIDAGTLQLASTGSLSGYPAVTVGANGTLNINGTTQIIGALSGSGTVSLGAGTLYVGADGSDSTFTGTILSNTGLDPTLDHVGAGTLTLNDVTMGQGQLIVTSGTLAHTAGTDQINYLAFGEGPGNSATGTISGGTLDIGVIGADPASLHSSLQVGDFGGTGLIIQTGGTVNITGSLNIGNQSGSGTYDLESGTLALLVGNDDLGRNTGSHAASHGTLNISGGLLDIVASNLILGNYVPNTATTQGNGLIVQTGGEVRVESGGGLFLSGIGNGEYDLDGGTLTVGAAGLHSSFNNNGGAGVLHWGGGTLQVIGSSLSTDVTIVLDPSTISNLMLGTLNASFTGGITGTGTLVVSGTGTASFSALNATGTLELQGSAVSISGAVGAGETVAFDGTGGALMLSAPDSFAGTISGFGHGDTIELSTIAYDGTGTADFNYSTDVLTITENGVSRTLHYAGQYFHLADDGHGKTAITEDGAITRDGATTEDGTACYCRGTLILTERGEVAVEDLNIGDRLVTASGENRPIRWIGSRAYSGRFSRRNKNVLPILIKQGALADQVPRRDLWVSPAHAMYLDGVLMPAAALLNGVSILQDTQVERIEYFHVELETHDVIVAEGALSESFLDDDNRGMFHNAASYRERYPEAMRASAGYCAPRVEDGELLQAVRDRIAARIGCEDRADAA